MKYDYIIVGAGSAGCVLANRLSADPAVTVLLLEAGGPDTKLEIRIPAAYSRLSRSEVDWGFFTEPQKHVLDRRMYLPRGKTLGGCSSINAMAYVRGNRADYDEWAALGNTGWSYEEVLPYFTRSEHNEQILDSYHGQQGPLNITFAQRFRTPVADAFVEACIQSGLPANPDFNGAEQLGAGLFQFTIKDQKRHSTAGAFLKPVLQRPNLKVITHAHTRQVLIKNDRAVGVEFITGKSTQVAYASREVILSAGSFNSPQLLMLSGIGDADELRKHQIPVRKHLPGVGKNLQDHLFLSVSALTTVPTANHYLKPHNQVLGILNYLLFKKGMFTTSPLEANAFLKLTDSPDPVDFQLHFAPIHIGNDYKPDFYDASTYPRTNGFTILPTILKPKSRGYVGLRSSSPLDAPVIQPNFLSEEDDVKTLIKGTRRALEVMRAEALDAFRTQIITPPDQSSDEAILLHIKKVMETVYHPVGTCKMGHDEMAVVDSELRVHGIEGLRLVDASIMPRIIAGNTNAAVIMIGEKGADLVLGRKVEKVRKEEGIKGEK
ncbi:GMC family oxidoreductase [Telluribacter humicola]|uniref:GMC family oxidoreductase n=1 Tax=Telluribacter humicola TaxID=1720261 RepID=UPI001A96DCB2|nr:GMC family oxidoreductase N-terminal domain-containing protein [Telluribacter humicola]